jgi:hypothetical protein
LKDDILATGYIAKAITIETDLDTPLYKIPQSTARYPPDIVVVPNPKGHRNAKKRTSNPHQIRLLDVDNAIDLWPQVKDDEWCCAAAE